MKTNFEKVVDFNTCFESYVSSVLNTQLFFEHPTIVNLKYNLINEEINELIDAYTNNDVIEIIDALSDIKYVLYGMACAFGINMNTTFRHYLSVFVKDIKLETNISNFDLVYSYHNHNNNINDYNNNITIPEFKESLDSLIKIISFINDELKLVTDDCNIDKIRINVCKLLYHVNMFGSIIGINLDKSFDIVHKSNMTKVCDSEQLAKDTVNWYLNNDKRYKTPSYKKNSFGYIVFNKDSGKILKSINYIPANFSSLFE